MKYRLVLASLLIAAASSIFAAPVQEESASVVATTSWTAAFALAAGAEDVYVLAPYEMQHPPEYELKPSDLVILAEADLVIFGGYERMAEKIKEALGADAPELLQVPTDYSLATLDFTIGTIAESLGRSIDDPAADYRAFYADWRSELVDLGLADAKVITHVFLKPIAEALGIEVLGVFGPAPLQAKQIADLSSMPADIILDNWHNEVGRPLIEIMDDTLVVELINFPGAEGTRTLMDVLELNRSRVLEAVR